MFYVVGWLVCMLVTALVANTKNRSPIGWALLAIPLGLIATVVVACSSKLPADEPTTMPGSPNAVKTCPRCAETVKAAAQVCRFCQHEFTSVASLPSATAAAQLPWTLEEDWGDGYGVYKYKGERLAFNKAGVKWRSATFETPQIAVASIDSYLAN